MDPAPDSSTLIARGLWSANPALVQLLGLCPLLAVSTSAVNALGLGLASLVALTLSNTAVSALRHWTGREVRIPAFVLIIATVVTALELAMHAWLPALHRVLGLFLPLIVTNCAILGRAEAFAARSSPARAALDGVAVGAGFLAVLLLLGALRELIGQGTLFAGAGPLLGWPMLEFTVLPDYRGFLPALLPPGAFVLLALLIALRNRVSSRRGQAAGAAAVAPTGIGT